jgi:VIT1/CCC1 family predicted Fe2+/Mn2+ transporter
MDSDSEVVNIAKKGLRIELTATEVYLRLCTKFKGEELSEKLRQFAEAETRHAEFWRTFLKNRNVDAGSVTFSKVEVSIIVFVYSLLGVALSLKLLEAGERRVIQLFARAAKHSSLSPEEMNEVRGFLAEELIHEEEFLDYEVKFRGFIDKIGTVFSQTSDGIVIVTSTSLGLAGVYTNSFWIGVVGLIVGFAATFSSIVQTYLVNRTALEFKKDILNKLKMSCEIAPEAYEHRIEKYMKRRDYDEKICRQIAKTATERNLVEKIIAEEEYGIRERSLEGPLKVALQTGSFKIVGVVLPMLPFLFEDLTLAIPASILITVLLLSVVGSLAALVAEVRVKRKVLQLTATGLLLSVFTFLVSKLAGILAAAMNLS